VREASRGEAIARLAETPHIILNAPLLGQRLGYPDVSGLDLLELFAFIHPARFAVPTVPGLARACGVEPPAGDAEAAAALVRIGEALLERLANPDWPEREGAWTANASLTRLGWSWASLVGKRCSPTCHHTLALILSPNKSVTDTLRAFANLTNVLNVGSYCPSSSRVMNVRDKPTFTASCSCVKPRLVRTR